jgi:hypothetical protein
VRIEHPMDASANNEFFLIADFDKEKKAARFANYLNGGIEPRALLEEMWPTDRERDWP